MWSKTGVRILSGVIGGICVLFLIFSGPDWLFHAAVVVACFLSLHELYMTFKQETKWQMVTLNYAFAAVFMAIPYLTAGTYPRELFTFVLVLYLMLLMICSIFWNDRIKFYDVSSSLFTLIYAVLFLFHLTFIRSMEHGVVLVMFPLIGAWMPDTFAFFAGKFFGRHKLIPSVSPNKTVEGAIGAVIGSVISMLVYGVIIESYFGLKAHYDAIVFLSLLCGVVAQLGDLAASVIKREYKAKDLGNLIPGHGGMLDRIDSLIFVTPLVYYFILYIPVIS
ncbi:MAG: phosphatidate cytidylyltransferase [Clostridia bacterium]|nr:phosphatidate cytidylyltransferase [Clostridia bacterium]